MTERMDNMGRRLRPWPHNPDYLVREDGAILHPRTGLVTMYDQHGYLAVMLQTRKSCDDDLWSNIQGKKQYRVNVVVCETFHGPRPDGMQAAHLDGDKRNNAASNLAWKTPTENAADKIAHGTHGWKLTEDAVRQIRLDRESGVKVVDLAARYSVSVTTVRHIVSGRTWGHVK